MLLRELELAPREEEHYWEYATIPLADGSTFYVERIVDAPNNSHGPYCCLRIEGPWKNGDDLVPGKYVAHSSLSEFEAQAVLDHYLQTIGPSNHDNN